MFNSFNLLIFLFIYECHPRIYLREVDALHVYNAKIIREAINLINSQSDTFAVRKCLSYHKIKNKAKCIKRITQYSRQGELHHNEDIQDYDYLEKPRSRPSRTKNFSQDYLDIKDLLRTNKHTYIFKILPNNTRKFYPNEFIKNNILRTVDDDYDYSDTDSENFVKPEYDSDESGSSEEILSKVKQVTETSSGKTMYMQAPNRIYKVSRRRLERLPYFYPKRHHWNEEEIKKLDNYWLSGPRGRYWGRYGI